jgi:hypothetical protein
MAVAAKKGQPFPAVRGPSASLFIISRVNAFFHGFAYKIREPCPGVLHLLFYHNNANNFFSLETLYNYFINSGWYI